MLQKDQLQTIASALENHPEATDDLKRIIRSELDYQTATATLWADREQILSKSNLTEEDDARLAELAEALSEASDRRPAEFGGMFHAIDLEAQNIIRRAVQLDDVWDVIHLRRKDVTQEFPEDGEEVLVWAKDGHISMAEFHELSDIDVFDENNNKVLYYFQPIGLPIISGVTHWARIHSKNV